jgi:hypothetical protein
MQFIPTATDAILIELISWDSPFSLSSRYLLGSLQFLYFGTWTGRVGEGETHIYLFTLTRRRLFSALRYAFWLGLNFSSVSEFQAAGNEYNGSFFTMV